MDNSPWTFTPMTELSYSEQRLQNIKNNRALLISLGLEQPLLRSTEPVEPKTRKSQSTSTSPRKRKSTVQQSGDDMHSADAKKPSKSAKVENNNGESRRSMRLVGKDKIDYANEQIRPGFMPISVTSGVRELDNEGPLGRQDGKRIHDPWVSCNITLHALRKQRSQKNIWFYTRHRWAASTYLILWHLTLHKYEEVGTWWETRFV